jgi:hypothetical protein
MGSGGADFGMTGVGKGGVSHQGKHAWQMAQQGYWGNRFKVMNDPFLKAGLWHSRDLARSDLMGMGRAIGNRAADVQSRSLQDALAARGGGNLASALALGSQARVGAGLQGLQAGVGLQMGANQALTGAATSRLGLINQLYGALQGVSSAQIGASYGLAGDIAKSAATAWSGLFQGVGSAVGGSKGGGGGGGGG